MLYILIATFAIGIGAAGAVYIAARALRRKLPSYTMPMAAGVAMFAFTLWNDYTWYARTAAALPDSVRVARTFDYASGFQPWTLLLPRIDRYAAVDMSTARRHESAPGVLIADVLLVARFAGSNRVSHAFDCAGFRRAIISSTVTFAADGRLQGVPWHDTAEDDPLVQAACRHDPSAAP